MDEVLVTFEYNGETGETIERPLTVDELDEIAALNAEIATQQAEAKAKTEARESALAKLAALGLTQEEIEAL